MKITLFNKKTGMNFTLFKRYFQIIGAKNCLLSHNPCEQE